MKRLLHPFNIYFTLACLLVMAGCATDKEAQEKKAHKKEQSTIRLYMEGPHADSLSTGTVDVTRNHIRYVVQREPFITEADLAKAQLVSDPDGTFAIQLVMNAHGTLLMEMYSADNKGKHIIVFTQFPKPGKKEKTFHKKSKDDDDVVAPASVPQEPDKPRDSGWIAAVLIRDRISNGVFQFTPDVSRAEGVRIVRGLKNVIAKAREDEK